MKVLQINVVSDFGSTGRTVIEMSQMLCERGHNMYVAYGHGTSTWKQSHKIGSVLENHLHNISARFTGVHGYGSKCGTKKLIDYIKTVRPDIIHLRTLHMFFINLELLFNFLKEYDCPIVWTLHDCWAFTGRCPHYTSLECDKWKTACTSPCPESKRYPQSLFIDRTSLMFADKKRLFTALPKLHIVTVSKWLGEQVEQSYFSKYPISTIYNWIDQDAFTPTSLPIDFPDVRQLACTDKVVICVTANWVGKKLEYLKALASQLPEGYVIVFAGKCDINETFTSNVYHIPYIEGKNKLAQLYSRADVYVHLSEEDTFGKVIAEALSCGTPVVGFDSTAITEIIGPQGMCGYSVPVGDITQLSAKVSLICQTGKDHYSQACRSWAESNFSMSKNILEYERLYENLVKQYNKLDSKE